MEKLTINELLDAYDYIMRVTTSGTPLYQRAESARYYLQQLLHYQKLDASFDHIRDLVEAEHGGLLVALPCKAGDTVYEISNNTDACNGCQHYHAYAHTRPDGSITPFAYGAMFEGSKIDTKLRSLSGQAPVNSLNATQEVTAAQANGSAWTIETWAFWNLIHDLLVLLGKSTNIQAVFGQGHTTGGSSAADLLTTGALNTSGQFFGYSDTTHSVKVFHMENFWGDRWDRIVGLIYDNGTYKAKMTPEDGGYNLTGAGYEAIRKGINATAAGGGWVKNAQQTEQGLFPTDLTGSDTTYDCDFHYYNPTIVSVPLVGGRCDNGSACGRYLYVNDVSGSAWWGIGASLFLQNPS